jgi:ribosome maturation factor RimP
MTGRYTATPNASKETCGSVAAFLGRVGLRPLLFLEGEKTPLEAGQTTNATDLQELVESRLAGLDRGLDVLLVEVVGAKGSPAIRVFLDHPDGVDHELCARATSNLTDLLRDYTVEVSSPGPSRPLTKVDHYRRFLGSRVRVRTREAIEGRSSFNGELVDVDERRVALAGEWGTVEIPHERIKRSNLVPQDAQVGRSR